MLLYDIFYDNAAGHQTASMDSSIPLPAKAPVGARAVCTNWDRHCYRAGADGVWVETNARWETPSAAETREREDAAKVAAVERLELELSARAVLRTGSLVVEGAAPVAVTIEPVGHGRVRVTLAGVAKVYAPRIMVAGTGSTAPVQRAWRVLQRAAELKIGGLV